MTTTDIDKFVATLTEIGVEFKDTRTGPVKEGIYTFQTSDTGENAIIFTGRGYRGFYAGFSFDANGKYQPEQSGVWE